MEHRGRVDEAEEEQKQAYMDIPARQEDVRGQTMHRRQGNKEQSSSSGSWWSLWLSWRPTSRDLLAEAEQEMLRRMCFFLRGTWCALQAFLSGAGEA